MNIYVHHIYVLCIHVLHGCGVWTLYIYIIYIYTHALEHIYQSLYWIFVYIIYVLLYFVYYYKLCYSTVIYHMMNNILYSCRYVYVLMICAPSLAPPLSSTYIIIHVHSSI